MNEERKLEDHIDEPIKKCVAGLALLGFKTVFSCCGFSYKGEKVQKAHLPLKSYFYLDMSDHLANQGKGGNPRLLLTLMLRTQWNLSYIDGKTLELFHLGFGEKHPWAAENSPHRAESNVLAINRLEKEITDMVEFNKDVILKLGEITIKDGNDTYVNDAGIKYWQYEPCLPWIVTYDVFCSL